MSGEPCHTEDHIKRLMREYQAELRRLKDRVNQLESAGNAIQSTISCGCLITSGLCRSCAKAHARWEEAMKRTPSYE
jgi:hypothetical protein